MSDASDILNELGIKINNNNKNELYEWLGKDMSESILDVEKKTLNKAIWNGKKLKDSVKKEIIDSLEEALKKSKIKLDDIDSIFLEGSNLTYYYNNYTDVDVHVYIKNISEEDANKLDESLGELNKNSIFINGTKNVLEFYRMDDEQVDQTNGPRYDLKNNKWLDAPKRVKMSKERYLAAIHIALTFARDLDLALGEIKRDIIGYIALDEEVEEILNVDIEQFEESKKMKLQEIKADLEALITKHSMIKDLRRKAFSQDFVPNEETIYRFKISESDRSYTLYNMIFKILQRFGYVDPLKILRYEIYDKALEKNDFEKNHKEYIKEIIKVLSLFNDISEERAE